MGDSRRSKLIPNSIVTSSEKVVSSSTSFVMNAKLLFRFLPTPRRAQQSVSKEVLKASLRPRSNSSLLELVWKVKEIRERFPEVNISFPDANLKSDIVNLRGPKNEVEKCYKYLKQIADELVEKNFRLEVPIFKQYHKNVIGKKGGNISKIREETGTQIELPTENSDNDVITIIGKKADCEKARDLIRAIEKEQADIVEEYVTISAKHHNSLIGAKGRLIRSIIDDCGQVQIHFPRGTAKSDEVHIRGPAANVAKAKEQLVALATQKELTGFTAEVHCKPELHRFLIGKGGSSIKKIRDETETRVIFPNANDADKTSITIIGKQENVETAKGLLEEQISGLENN